MNDLLITMTRSERIVNFDFGREKRIGIKEAIFAEGKTLKEFQTIIESMKDVLDRSLILATRVRPEQYEWLETNSIPIKLADTNKRTLLLGNGDIPIRFEKPQILLVSGGTSDLALVEEIAISLLYHGVPSINAIDIGVANLERIKIALEKIETHKDSLKLIIAVAGFEGALFPVINSLSKLPVIAVPSPQGYGKGGQGEAALMTALQTCSSGVATMNIGNGFGAAAFAVKLVNTFEALIY